MGVGGDLFWLGDIEKINATEVPDAIDGICIYFVPLKNNLKHCKKDRDLGVP